MPFYWTLIAASADETTIRLQRPGVVTMTQVEKWITLRRDDPRLHFPHVFVNDGSFPLDFHWKLHPALAIGPDARIDLLARRVIVDEAFRTGFAAHEFLRPHALQIDG